MSFEHPHSKQSEILKNIHEHCFSLKQVKSFLTENATFSKL